MQKDRPQLLKKLMLFTGLALASAQATKAQSVYLPQQYQLYQKFNGQVYSKDSKMHTSLRPFLIDSTLKLRYDELMNVGVDTNRKSWILRKLFNEHLLQVNKKDFTFFADLLTENIGGHDFKDKSNTAAKFQPIGFGPKFNLGINTRGFQAGGTVGDKFYFYTSGYENQGVFPGYYNDYVNTTGVVPGQAYDRSFGKTEKDWSYATAILSYSVNNNVNVTLGQDKTFIGDGYRSILLSDYAANYPLLRVTANIGPVQYMMMWTYLQDIKAPKFDSFGSNRRKYALYHYFDWNATNSLSLGFFNAVVAAEADDQGNRRGFDVNFINPLFFTANKGASGYPDNTLYGFNAKYKVLDKNAIYAQLLLDKATPSAGGRSSSTGGYQVGIRGGDVAGVKNLSYLFEYNTVKPYTYADQYMLNSYTFYGEPMGHLMGANFREFVGIINYTIGRVDLQGQLNYARYGLDVTGTNVGKNINLPYVSNLGNTVGQGLTTNLYYAEGTASFLLNPKYNLRFELSGLYRREKNDLGVRNNAIISFGLRSTFRNLYKDF